MKEKKVRKYKTKEDYIKAGEHSVVCNYEVVFVSELIEMLKRCRKMLGL